MDFARCTHDTLTPNRPPARGGPTLHVCRTELPRPPARGGPTLHVCRTELPRPPARGGPTLHVCRLRATLPVASLPIFAFYPCFTCSRHYRRNIKTFHRV